MSVGNETAGPRALCNPWQGAAWVKSGPQLKYANVRPTIYDDYKASQSSEGPGNRVGCCGEPKFELRNAAVAGVVGEFVWKRSYYRKITRLDHSGG